MIPCQDTASTPHFMPWRFTYHFKTTSIAIAAKLLTSVGVQGVCVCSWEYLFFKLELNYLKKVKNTQKGEKEQYKYL